MDLSKCMKACGDNREGTLGAQDPNPTLAVQLCLPPHLVPAPDGAGNASSGEQSSMLVSQKICPFLLLAASSYAGPSG